MGARKPQKKQGRGLKANRRYKSLLFELLHNDEKVVLELANIFLKTDYRPNTPVKINTIRNTLSQGGRANDLSFLVDEKLLVLVEHQSTVNQNMPYRLLHYIVEIYKSQIEKKREYGRRKIELVHPKFIVLYNGPAVMPNKVILRLSDLMAELPPTAVDGLTDLELTATVYNINKGYNEKIVKRCKTLYGYIIFVDMVRRYQKKAGVSLEEAIRKAVDACIERAILKEFLLKHRREIDNMLMVEWNLDEALEVEREEGWEEGREEGIKIGLEEGFERGIRKEKELNALAMKKEGIDPKTIARITGLTKAEINRL